MLQSMAEEASSAFGQLNDQKTLLKLFHNFTYNTEVGDGHMNRASGTSMAG